MENVMGQINYLAVLAAAVSAFLLGGLWYGPLFGSAWMDASGVTPETRQPGRINYQFEGKPLKLLLVNGGYHTVQYTLYGLILGLWH